MLADRMQADRLLDTAEMLTGLVDDEYPWGNACRRTPSYVAVPDPERVTAIAAEAAGLVRVTGSARLRKELMALPRQAAAGRNTPHGRQLRAIVGSVA